jgi:hypothetical protein
MPGGLADTFKKVTGDLAGWAGGKLADFAGWGAKQALNGVTSTFTGSADPNAGVGAKLGSSVNDWFHNKSWIEIIGSLLFGWMAFKLGDLLPGGLMTRIPLVIGAVMVGGQMANKLMGDFSASANNTTQAKPVPGVKFSPQTPRSQVEHPELVPH